MPDSLIKSTEGLSRGKPRPTSSTSVHRGGTTPRSPAINDALPSDVYHDVPPRAGSTHEVARVFRCEQRHHKVRSTGDAEQQQ
ncbi:hypothetical protein GQ600_1735 [Phytophthora cactorum]|nr:hypothetical protein GQ600_1735 [Phytophthora cactorum]